ncbi:unnamed protein product [Sympodiomycopsis kandeliae]
MTHLDRTFSAFASFAAEKASQGNQNKLSFAGALTVAAAAGYLLLPTLDRPTRPKVVKGPELSNEPAYPHDVLPGGAWLQTPLGRIRYYEFGPEDGKKVLLVHGITTPTPVWKSVAPQLAKAGYRVLTFDLYGRGYSDSPSVPHDVPLFMSQISYLLTALPEWTKFHLIGMSLGGGIVANFAYYFPNRVDKLIMICPAGATPRSALPAGFRVFLSNYLSIGNMQTLARTLPLGLPLSSSNPLVHWQTKKHPGFFFSFLSSLREGPIFDQSDIIKTVIRDRAERGTVSAIWGDSDSIVPMERSLKHLDEEGEVLRNLTTVVKGGEHFIVVTRPEEVLNAVLKNLAS